MSGQQNNGLWYLGAVVVAALLGILGWFLLISPEVDATAEARENTELARDQNDLLEIQIARMQALEQEAPQWREEIAKISMDLPPMPDEPEVIRLLVSTIEDAGLPVTGITYGRPTEIAPVLSTADVLPPEEDAPAEGANPSATPNPTPSPSASGDAAGSTEPAPAESTEAPFVGLYGMQVTFQLEGSPDAVLGVLNTLSSQNERFFTIGSLSVAGASESDEAEGRPALTTDDWTVDVTGLVFSLTEDGRTIISDEQGELAPFNGSGVDNAFSPLAGTESAE